MIGLGTVKAPVGMSFSLLMCYNWAYAEAQGLVRVDSSTILELYGSNQFMLGPRAMSFF